MIIRTNQKAEVSAENLINKEIKSSPEKIAQSIMHHHFATVLRAVVWPIPVTFYRISLAFTVCPFWHALSQ